MKITIIKVNIFENKEVIMTRFLNSLNSDIGNVAKFQHYLEIQDMVHMAIKCKNN